jgi:hypothetical protein
MQDKKSQNTCKDAHLIKLIHKNYNSFLNLPKLLIISKKFTFENNPVGFFILGVIMKA